MNEFAARPAPERAEVFEETAVRRGIGRPVIVEKDFWVCWVLGALFGPGESNAIKSASPPALVFKGGTSLSKVYGLIDRFSEDVDLTVDRSVLVDINERPDALDLSNQERRRRIERVEARCIAYVRDEILTALRTHRVAGTPVDIAIDPDDAQTLLFSYPKALSAAAYGGSSYVHPVIVLSSARAVSCNLPNQGACHHMPRRNSRRCS